MVAVQLAAARVGVIERRRLPFVMGRVWVGWRWRWDCQAGNDGAGALLSVVLKAEGPMVKTEEDEV